MKSYILIFGLFLIFITLTGCTKSDDSNDCSLNVTALLKQTNCISNCTYTVTYVSVNDKYTSIDTNKATYDYYIALWNDESYDGFICWEGEKE